VSAAALDRAWLGANLPHQGAMNLLDAIVSWDDAGLTASASGHRSQANPLRRGNELPITCAIEYGAQAAAAHGALLESHPSGPGMLVAVRSVDFHADRLDDVATDLDIRVEHMGGGEAGVLYRFAVSAAGRVLAEGRLTVAFAPGTAVK
jgi:predicted hotdog family 3-hydroxylacyl-ACP dehydratase